MRCNCEMLQRCSGKYKVQSLKGGDLDQFVVVGWSPATVRTPHTLPAVDLSTSPDGWEVEGVLQQGRLYLRKSNCSRPSVLREMTLAQVDSSFRPRVPLEDKLDQDKMSRPHSAGFVGSLLIAAARPQLLRLLLLFAACRASLPLLFFSLFFSSDLRFFSSWLLFCFSFLSGSWSRASSSSVRMQARSSCANPGSRAWRRPSVGLHSFRE
ncbi:hypothetical protein GWK47_048960 [Chionoecetes opilio]|uniref:Uncharacterized protein n=1 Tax=Chionoecetes opilio TaxID=41210 RepID=A0A8J5CTK2_CHIOP|nr:hypothetical protein GWK47_048960 [Chionoecetes opilio]